MRRWVILLMLVICGAAAFFFWRTRPAPMPPAPPVESAPGAISILSTVGALQQGHCEGLWEVRQVREGAALGLAVRNGLAAEIVVEGGQAYEIGEGGLVAPARDLDRVAFAVLSPFQPDQFFDVGSANAQTFRRAMDWKRTATNQTHAYRVQGIFDRMDLCALANADRPCPSLDQALRGLRTNRLSAVAGHMVGFWFPPSLKDVGGDGYQFYFLDEARQFGGRVIDFQLRQGRIEVDSIERLQVAFSP